MPRESRAIPKYGGSEIEWGIKSSNIEQGPGGAAWDFVSLIKSEWLPGCSFSSWDARPRMAGERDGEHGYFADASWRASNLLLQNGARLYVDGAHPELSTALCRNGGKEKLAHYLAADQIIQLLVERHREEGRNFTLFKNNYGFDPLDQANAFLSASPDALSDFAVSFAHHDNYLVRRDMVRDSLIARTIPWLILRQIFNGQGKVGSHNRLVTKFPWCDFQISQRADFFSDGSGGGTMGVGDSFPAESCRPIFNRRDVPYADRALYQRLHMIPADHNMCESAYFLTIALTEIHFMMIEDGFLDDRFALCDSTKAFWQISRDLEFQDKLSLEHPRRKPRTPLDVLEEYVELMGEYLTLYGIQMPEYHEAVSLGLGVIEKLRKNQDDCIGVLDWVTKRAVMRDRMEGGKLDSFRSHKAIQIDLGYAKIDPARSIFWVSPLIQNAHRNHRIISDDDIVAAMQSPPPTRSAFQVLVHNLFGADVREWHWAETIVWVPEDRASYLIDLGNPLMTEAEYTPLLDGADKDEFLRRAVAAGIAKKYGLGYTQSARRSRYPYHPDCDD